MRLVTIGQALVHSNIGDDCVTDGGLAKSGANSLTRFGANTYTGATTVQTGTLALDATGGIASSNSIIVGDAGSSDPGFWDTNQTWSDAFTATNSDDLASVFSHVKWYQGSPEMTGATGTQGAFTPSATNLTWSAVPEPSSAPAGILLGAGLLRRRCGD